MKLPPGRNCNACIRNLKAPSSVPNSRHYSQNISPISRSRCCGRRADAWASGLFSVEGATLPGPMAIGCARMKGLSATRQLRGRRKSSCVHVGCLHGSSSTCCSHNRACSPFTGVSRLHPSWIFRPASRVTSNVSAKNAPTRSSSCFVIGAEPNGTAGPFAWCTTAATNGLSTPSSNGSARSSIGFAASITSPQPGDGPSSSGLPCSEANTFPARRAALYAGKHLMAAHLGLRSGRVLHGWLPVYNRCFQKYSPGIMMWALLADLAPDLGITRIDLGRGPEHYKDRLKTGEITVAQGIVDRRFARRTFRTAWRRMRLAILASPLGNPLRKTRTCALRLPRASRLRDRRSQRSMVPPRR